MQIPLFPLHTVLAPGIALPLHVFEDRYRVMVRRCLDAAAPFGIVLIREGREVAPADGPRDIAIAGVGTFAEIREASLYSDGSWDLLVVGTSRFAVGEVFSGVEPYLLAEVEPAPDDDGDPDIAAALAERVMRRFSGYLRLLQPRDGEDVEPIDVQLELEVDEDEDDIESDDAAAGSGPGDDTQDDDGEAGGRSDLVAALRIPDDPSALSFLLTGIVQVDPARRQSLLEASSAEERLADLDDLLDLEIALLRQRLGPYAFDRRLLASREN